MLRLDAAVLGHEDVVVRADGLRRRCSRRARSAPGFHDSMIPSRVWRKIASLDDSTIAESARMRSSACLALGDVAERRDHEVAGDVVVHGADVDLEPRAARRRAGRCRRPARRSHRPSPADAAGPVCPRRASASPCESNGSSSIPAVSEDLGVSHVHELATWSPEDLGGASVAVEDVGRPRPTRRDRRRGRRRRPGRAPTTSSPASVIRGKSSASNTCMTPSPTCRAHCYRPGGDAP